MDGQTQQHLHLRQNTVPSSTGSESTTPGTEMNRDMVETTRRLEQSYTLPIQPNEGARTTVEDVAASPARNETFGSLAYDAMKKMCSSIAAQCKDIPTTLWQTFKKKFCDGLIGFAISQLFKLFQKVDLASAVKLIISAVQTPWKFFHVIDSFLAARYPWLRLVIAICCPIILAALPFVLIIWIIFASPITGLPDAHGQRCLFMIALVLFPWIGYTAVMLEVPAPKAS
ncbi:hypothetical protein BDR22DRAFT_822492 [Usnea florida]